QTDFAAEANALCRSVLDARDYEAFAAARSAAMDRLAESLRGPLTAPPASLVEMFRTVRDDLVATLSALRTLVPASPSLAADFAVFLSAGEAELRAVEARLELLSGDGPWTWPPFVALAV